MFTLAGKYGTAIVYAAELEDSAVAQIIAILNHPASEGANIRIMPDAHYGKGCVIGYTAKRTDKVVPNLIGVDKGCGILSFMLGEEDMFKNHLHNLLDLDSWDAHIRRGIPSGEGKFRSKKYRTEMVYNLFWPYLCFRDYGIFINELGEVCRKQGQNLDTAILSLGTLGGGNHFIELGKDEEGFIWQTFHSGSRGFGNKSARYHQAIALEKCGPMSEMEYLEGNDLGDYYHDLQIAQEYAKLNRYIMAFELIHYYFKLNVTSLHMVESIHNYVDFEDNIIRKGAINASKGREVIIPFNMADGLIIGTGKGNEDWNNSAPHGSGRTMGRNAAKRTFVVEQFEEKMKAAGVQSKCINQGTLDESPMAYKDTDTILNLISETVEVTARVRPLFAFKAEEKERRKKNVDN